MVLYKVPERRICSHVLSIIRGSSKGSIDCEWVILEPDGDDATLPYDDDTLRLSSRLAIRNRV